MVCLVKFIAKAINGLKTRTKLQALGQTKMTLDVIYATYFFSINAFLDATPPEKAHRLAWRYWVIPSIDTNFNLTAKQRAKDILQRVKKNKIVVAEDKTWIREELKPYFEKSLKDQLNKSINELEKIDLLKVKDNIKRYEKDKEMHYK